MSLTICSWGILLHSSCKAAPKAWSIIGRGTLCRTRWPRMSQTCSIGDVRESSRPVEMIHIVLMQELLYSPDEVLRFHPAALRGVVEQKAEQPAVALH